MLVLLALFHVCMYVMSSSSKGRSVMIPVDFTVVGNEAIAKSIDYAGDIIDLVIPDYYTVNSDHSQEIPITKIAPNFGLNCTITGNLVLGKYIREIGDFAYSKQNIMSVTFGSHISYIGKGAFERCLLLRNVTFPSGVDTIGEYSFYQCLRLTSINLEGAKYIMMYSFYECSRLMMVNLSNSVEIHSFAFCRTSLISIGKECYNLQLIGSYAFFNCASLSSLPSFNKTIIIEASAFQDCHSLPTQLIIDWEYVNPIIPGCKSIITIRFTTNVRYIGRGFLDHCSSAKLLIFDDNPNASAYLEFGKGAFALSTSLQTLNIPIQLKSIGGYAFFKCFNLEINLTIPPGVESIGEHSFNGCKSIYFVNISHCNNWKEIPDYCFHRCESMKCTMVLPQNIIRIGIAAFCASGIINSLIIPDSVTSIDSKAFADCKSLTGYIQFSNNLVSIGDYAFANCPSIKCRLVFPKSLKYIGDGAFANDIGLKDELYIHSNYIRIGKEAFYGCSGLSRVSFEDPKSSTDFGERVFFQTYLDCTSNLPKSCRNNNDNQSCIEFINEAWYGHECTTRNVVHTGYLLACSCFLSWIVLIFGALCNIFEKCGCCIGIQTVIWDCWRSCNCSCDSEGLKNYKQEVEFYCKTYKSHENNNLKSERNNIENKLYSIYEGCKVPNNDKKKAERIADFYAHKYLGLPKKIPIELKKHDSVEKIPDKPLSDNNNASYTESATV